MNNNINIDAFGDWQHANTTNILNQPTHPPPSIPVSSAPTLNQINEFNRLNISNQMIYSKLEKLEYDIEEIKKILMKIYVPQPINYQMQPSLFTGTNMPFMNNNQTNYVNNSVRPMF